MQIVIEIDKEVYEFIRNMQLLKNGRGSEHPQNKALFSIQNGTPLPKGHGRLIDGDKLANDDRVCEGYSCTECPFEIFRHHSCRLMNFIKDYPTIIESDKEG